MHAVIERPFIERCDHRRKLESESVSLDNNCGDTLSDTPQELSAIKGILQEIDELVGDRTEERGNATRINVDAVRVR